MPRRKGIKEEHNDIRTFALPSVAPLMLSLVALFSGKRRLPKIAIEKPAGKRNQKEKGLIEKLIGSTFTEGTEFERDSEGDLVPSLQSTIILNDTPIVFATGQLENTHPFHIKEDVVIDVQRTFGAEGLRHFLALIVLLEEHNRTGHFQWNVNNVLENMGYERDPSGSFNIELKQRASRILHMLTGLTIIMHRKSGTSEEVRLQKLFHIDALHKIAYPNGLYNETISIQASAYWYQDAFFKDSKNRKGQQYTKLLRKIITENHWKHDITIYLSTLLSIFWRISKGKPRTLSVANLAKWCNIDLETSNRAYHWKKLVDELTYMRDHDYLGDFQVRKLRTSAVFHPSDLIDFYPPHWLNEEFERIKNKQDEIISSRLATPLAAMMTLDEFRGFAEQLQLSNRDLAKRLEISHTMVNLILAGKRRIAAEIGAKLRLLVMQSS